MFSLGLQPAGPVPPAWARLPRKLGSEVGHVRRREVSDAHGERENRSAGRRLRELRRRQLDARVRRVAADAEEIRAVVGGHAVRDEDKDLLAACHDGGLGLIRLELAVAAGQRRVRGSAKIERRRGQARVESAPLGCVHEGHGHVARARERTGCGIEDDEPRGDPRVGRALHLAEDRLERGHDRCPLVVVAHAVGPVEHEEEVNGGFLGDGRRLGAARIPDRRGRAAGVQIEAHRHPGIARGGVIPGGLSCIAIDRGESADVRWGATRRDGGQRDARRARPAEGPRKTHWLSMRERREQRHAVGGDLVQITRPGRGE